MSETYFIFLVLTFELGFVDPAANCYAGHQPKEDLIFAPQLLS